MFQAMARDRLAKQPSKKIFILGVKENEKRIN